jgi:hypothetical protein
MDGDFSFRVDRATSLVRITMSGLFTRADVAAFIAARNEAHAALACGPNRHLTLNDLRGLKIQPQEIVAEFRDMLGAPQYRSRKLAFVLGATLARAQLMRALGGRQLHCFETIEDAEAWLLAEEEDAAAA